MSLKCLFGHKWNGCKCERCSEIRNEQHDWDLCKGKCKRCGETQPVQHDWNGCKCSRCGITRDEQHDWNVCVCKRCGKTRNEQHDWKGLKCNRCGKERYIWNITDQTLLTDFAKHGKKGSDRVAAAERLNDQNLAQEVYIDVAKNDPDIWAQSSAVRKLNDRKLLEEIVRRTNGANEVGRAAKNRLLEIAVENNDEGALNESMAQAACNNDTAKVLSLLQKGADANATYSNDTPALVWACHNGNLKVSTALIEAGADVNKYGAEKRTPLMEVAQKGYHEDSIKIIELLIKHGADVNAADQYGSSALRLAQRKGLTNVVQVLSAHGGKYLGA